jgi:hypothetical protein
VTDEHLITPEELTRVGGSIAVRFVGFVAVTDSMLVTILVKQRKNQLPKDGNKERESAWRVNGDKWEFALSLR